MGADRTPLVVVLFESLEPRTLLSTPGANWKLAWSDEFNGTQLDSAKWSIGLPWTGDDGTNRHFDSNFLSYISDDDVQVSGGTLKLLTQKQDVTSLSGAVYHYTEGLITTAASLWTRYGYIEARAQFPAGAGRGLWPAIWMLGSGWPPEDDIAEWFSSSGRFHQGLAYPGKNGVQWDDRNTYQPMPTGFHTYGMQWGPGYQIFYVDDQITHVSRGSYVPRGQMYLLLNSGVEAAQPPDAATVFPNAFEVDYVRVYKRTAQPQIDNGGFEGGQPGLWTITGHAAVVSNSPRSGTYALRTQAAGDSGSQTITGLKPHTSYVLTAWAKTSDPATQATIGVSGFGGPDQSQSISSANYSPANITFSTGPTNTFATVSAAQSDGSGIAYFDDFDLHLVGQIEDGGFESGSLAAWSTSGAVSVMAGQSHAGAYSLREDGSGAIAQQTISGLAPNTAYRLTGWARGSGLNDPAVIAVTDSSGATQQAQVDASAYHPVSLTFTTGPASTWATVFCSKPLGSGSAWFDDLKLLPPRPLTISSIHPQVLRLGRPRPPIRFLLGGFFPPNSATLSATSSNPAVLPVSSLLLGQSGPWRTLRILPQGSAGTTTITITAADASGRSVSRNFAVRVVP